MLAEVTIRINGGMTMKLFFSLWILGSIQAGCRLDLTDAHWLLPF